MPITPLFAAIFGLLYFLLSIDVIRFRIAGKVSLGSGDSKPLEKAIRIHGNFAEYVPMCLLLFWLIESLTFNSRLVFWLGCVLLIGRVAHVLGMRDPKSLLVLRQLGVVATLSVLSVSCVYLLWWYLPV